MINQFELKNSLFFIIVFSVWYKIRVTQSIGILHLQRVMSSFKMAVFNAGMITLSPIAEALVCEVGDQVQLTCSINGNFMRWNLTVGNEQGVPQEYQRNINSQDGSQQTSHVTVNSTTFTFMRNSQRHRLPLVSTLVISIVSRDLNGVVVYCTDVGMSITAATTICLFEVGKGLIIIMYGIT